MSENSSSVSGGIGFPDLLTVLFIYLKLTHQIDWSWWWVWSPMLAVVGLVVAILIIGLLILALAWAIDTWG